MLDIAIVDDELAERERLKACLAYVEQQQDVSFSVKEYDSADQFLMMFEQQFDIIFMDIQFAGGTDGMCAARQLRKVDPSVILIFVTNLAQMAIHGYEVDALDFVVKPLDKFAFHLKMQRALNRVSSRMKSMVEVRDKGSTVYLDAQRIRYLEVNGHYVIYHTRGGNYSEYITMAAAEKKLNDPAFFRCDRGLLINMRMLTKLDGDTCVVDGETLIVAHILRNELKRAFANYLSGTQRAKEL